MNTISTAILEEVQILNISLTEKYCILGFSQCVYMAPKNVLCSGSMSLNEKKFSFNEKSEKVEGCWYKPVPQYFKKASLHVQML